MSQLHQILVGVCIDMMRTLPDYSVHTCVTSPPYYCLRDYGVEGRIG
ncbi:site-specific DNA-methyltransferase, partial [Pseudomonas syringae pv. tagetis]